MRPIEPELHEKAHRVIFAKNQPPFIPLPASVDSDGTVMTEWIFSAEDLAALMRGGKLRLWILYTTTHLPHDNPQYRPFTPVKLEIIE